MIKEIIDLGERIYNETPAYLSIDISTGTGSVNIYIIDLRIRSNKERFYTLRNIPIKFICYIFCL